jgi:hypothetical protein
MASGLTRERNATMHRDIIDLGFLAGRSQRLGSKRFVFELHEQGLTCDDAIAAVFQVFHVTRGAARLFVVWNRRG